jgi:hypothetical protein
MLIYIEALRPSVSDLQMMLWTDWSCPDIFAFGGCLVP